MKILASALVDAVRTYLHAGYVSGAPRPIDPHEVYSPETVGEVSMQLDMVEALRLQGEAAAAAAMPDGGATIATAAASGSLSMLGAAAAATAGAAGFALLHRRLGLRPRMAMAAGALAGLITAGQLSCIGPEDDFDQEAYEKSLPAPWEDVELRAYADPEAATNAILNAIVCSGLKGVDFPVHELRHIQLEVGLPTDNPTEGMAYALQTYGYDGWGRELDFRVDVSESSGITYRLYYVTSAGPDGELRTEDDISIDNEANREETPGQRGCGTFLRRDADGSLVSLFHRVRGEYFVYNHADEAEALTGDDLFDMFTEADLSPWLDTLEEQYDTVAAEVDHDPLLFQLRGADG